MYVMNSPGFSLSECYDFGVDYLVAVSEEYHNPETTDQTAIKLREKYSLEDWKFVCSQE